LERRRIAPGVTEIIFRAGAKCGGKFFAVHKKLFAALADSRRAASRRRNVRGPRP
jgi:hypothetical protein